MKAARAVSAATNMLVLIGLVLVLVPFAATAAPLSSSVRLDRSFGRTGWIKTRQGTGGAGGRVEVSVAPDGESVVADLLAGQIFRLRADGGPQDRFGHRGYRSVGSSIPDPNGGVHGWVRTDFPPALELSSAQGKLDQQGRLVVAGTASTSNNDDAGFLVARYLLPE